MPLKSYTKVTTYRAPSLAYSATAPISFSSSYCTGNNYSDANKTTMWSLMAGVYRSLKYVVASSSIAGLIIPTLFILVGLGFVYLQFQPSIKHKFEEYSGNLNQGTTTLVSEGYIVDKLQYVSNPGASYFQQLSNTALNTVPQNDPYSKNYRGTMYLTIPSLKFNRLPITANVQSNSKDAYDRVLASSLAHFKGTGLPGSEIKNNIVLYGHSAGGAYNPSPTDVLAAFSFLSNLKVGDLITLEKDGIEYQYRMIRSQIVEPTDANIITGTPGKETLTLFTCWRPGTNSHRLVITATPVD